MPLSWSPPHRFAPISAGEDFSNNAAYRTGARGRGFRRGVGNIHKPAQAEGRRESKSWRRNPSRRPYGAEGAQAGRQGGNRWKGNGHGAQLRREVEGEYGRDHSGRHASSTRRGNRPSLMERMQVPVQGGGDDAGAGRGTQLIHHEGGHWAEEVKEVGNLPDHINGRIHPDTFTPSSSSSFDWVDELMCRRSPSPDPNDALANQLTRRNVQAVAGVDREDLLRRTRLKLAPGSALPVQPGASHSNLDKLNERLLSSRIAVMSRNFGARFDGHVGIQDMPRFFTSLSTALSWRPRQYQSLPDFEGSCAENMDMLNGCGRESGKVVECQFGVHGRSARGTGGVGVWRVFLCSIWLRKGTVSMDVHLIQGTEVRTELGYRYVRTKVELILRAKLVSSHRKAVTVSPSTVDKVSRTAWGLFNDKGNNTKGLNASRYPPPTVESIVGVRIGGGSQPGE
ncbi:hypothetical protein DFH06DRAFT_1124586 [Mycena polygramma]|nr:hypothetical protein DFH06DRAFT_1124586 [Mycena polygramma]